MDNDRANEQLTIVPQTSTNLFTDIVESSITLNCILNNTSTLPVQIVRLWIEDTSNNAAGSVLVSSAEGTLRQGQTISYSGTVSLQVANPSTDLFRFWFVTSRGNQFTLQQSADGSQVNINQFLSGVIGDFLPDYNSVQWGKYVQVGSQYGVESSSWKNGWVIPISTSFQIVWRVTCTYNGASDLTLDQNSMLFFVPSDPRNGGGHALNPFMTYIVGNTTAGNNDIITNYPPSGITVSPSEKITLYFGSQTPGGVGGMNNDIFSQIGPSLMSLTVYGKYPSVYAQSFPLFAVVSEPVHFEFSPINPQTAGTPFYITISAKYGSGITVNSYSGTPDLTCSAGLISPTTTTSFSHGVWTGLVYLTRTGSDMTISATDGSNAGTSGTFIINPAAASTLLVSGFPSSTVAGLAHDVTITAKDSYGNTATGYVGMVHFTSSDPLATAGFGLPNNYQFLVSDNGQHTFTNGVTFKTAGSQSITGTDTVIGTVAGTQDPIVVSPAAASTFLVSGFPSNSQVGSVHSITVEAKDLYGNPSFGYVGTVHFSSNDVQAFLPPDYTFLSNENGIHFFSNSVAFNSIGANQFITVTDTTISSITGSQTNISIRPAPRYVDSSNQVHDINIGSHSNFLAMQTGPDGIFDILEEGATTSLTQVTMGTTTNTGTSYTQIAANGIAGQSFAAPSGSTNIAGVTFFGRTSSGTFNVKAIITDSLGNILPNGVSSAVSCSTTAQSRTTNFAIPPTITPGSTYWILIISQSSSFRLYYVGTTGGISKADPSNDYVTPVDPSDASTGTINYRGFFATVNRANNELNSEVQFSGVTDFESYSQLLIQTGAFSSPAETIIVDYWTGTSWSNLGTLEANSPNAFDVSLASADYALRFTDGTTANDSVQSTWQIDSIYIW